MKRCESCGHLNKKSDSFCEECGAPLLNQSVDWQIKQLQPMNKKVAAGFPVLKKRLLFLGLVLIFMFCGLLYKWGEQRFSKEQQIADFMQNIEAQDTHAISQRLTTNDSTFAITPGSIKPLVVYLKENPKERKKVQRALQLKQKIHGLSIQQVGHSYFFFPRYQFVLTPVHVQVATNQENVQLKVNQSVLGTSDSQHYQQSYGPIAPGNYTFQATIHDPISGNIVQEEKHVIDAETYSPEIHFTFKKITIPITSNLTDADIYINNKKIGTYASGTQIVGPLFWRKHMTIQLKKTVNGETIETAKETISEMDFNELPAENLTLHLNFPLVTNYDIRSALETFYQDLTTVSQQQEPATAKDFAAKYLLNARANPAYEELWKLLASGALSKKTPNYEVAVNEFKLVGKDTYQVNYRLQVTFNEKSAKKDLAAVEWIDDLSTSITITKSNESNPSFKFVTLEERMLNWLLEQQSV